MTDPPAKTTWIEESFDDVNIAPRAASAGAHGACRAMWELSCIGLGGSLLFLCCTARWSKCCCGLSEAETC